MKSQKGITLISLIVYVIVMLVVVTIIGTITSYFYDNVNDQYQESKDQNGENILDMYLTKDLKNQEITIKTADSEEINEEENTIKLMYEDSSTVIYTITSNGIYRNAVKIYNIEDDVQMIFTLGDKLPSTSNSIIYEKQELKIEKITPGQENDVFKTYTINTKSKAIYETNEGASEN